MNTKPNYKRVYLRSTTESLFLNLNCINLAVIQNYTPGGIPKYEFM